MMGVGWNLGMVSWIRGYKAKVVKKPTQQVWAAVLVSLYGLTVWCGG